MKLLALIGTVLPFALVGMLWLIYSGEPLADLESEFVERDSDPLARAQEAIVAGRVFECSQEELNAHLERVLLAREADGFEIFAEFERVWIRLLEGGFELVFERDVLGMHSTVAAKIRVRKTEGGHELKVVGGRFGRLPAPPGAMHLVKGGLANLAEALAPEKGVLSELGEVTIAPGRLRLVPRPPS